MERIKDRLKVGFGHNTEKKENYNLVVGYIKSKGGLIGEVSITIEFDDNEWSEEYKNYLIIDKEEK